MFGRVRLRSQTIMNGVYDQNIVNQRLEIAARSVGFTPERHSPEECDDFTERLSKRYEDVFSSALRSSQGSKSPVQDSQNILMRGLMNPEAPRLRRDEVRWIQNERALAMCDASYFLTRYYFIKTPQKIQRFTFLPGQQVYFDVISQIESMRAAIELICCKARQHGISTATEGLTLHKANFGYGVNCVIASADRTKTGKMAQMTMMGYDFLPWWMRTPYSRRVESDQGMLVFGGSKSGISFQHGSQTSGIARGDTVKTYHLSECASYTNPAEQIEASLFKCVHAHPDVLGVLESTAEGKSGWFHDTYWQSKRDWSKGMSRLCAVFLPWFLGTDKFPTDTWIRSHPVPFDWTPNEATRQMMRRATAYVGSNPVLEKVLGYNFELPAHQAWFWEVSFLESRAKGLQKFWAQEMPSDDREAFQGSYENVFGREVIAEVDSRRQTKYHVYGIIGQSIEERHEPPDEERDPSEPIVLVKYSDRRNKTYKWEFVPLVYAEQFELLEDIKGDQDSHKGKLFVYLEPEPGYDYSVGVKTTNGIGSGDTVIAVSRRARGAQEQDEQAAEFRSDKVSHVEAYAPALAICAYYSKFMGAHGVRHKEPYVAIEQVESVGDTCQLQMSKMGYRRFHRMIRYDSQPKNMREANSTRRGWYTVGWSRPMLTDSFVVLVQNGWYKVNSPFTIWEMDNWEVHSTASGKDKFIHSTEATDDGVFANAMAAFCPNHLKPLAERTTKRFMDFGREQKPMVDVTPISLAGTSFPLVPYNPRHGQNRILPRQP